MTNFLESGWRRRGGGEEGGGWYLPVNCDNQVPNFLVNFGFGKSRGCVVFD